MSREWIRIRAIFCAVVLVAAGTAASCSRAGEGAGAGPAVWRVYLHEYSMGAGAANNIDRGGIVVGSSGEAATVVPASVLQFPCVYTVGASALRRLAILVPEVRSAVEGPQGSLGAYPSRNSSVGRKMWDSDSPYRNVVLVIDAGDSFDDLETNRLSFSHAGIQYLRSAYPALAGLLEALDALQSELPSSCGSDALAVTQ